MMNHSFHTHHILLPSLGTKPEFTNRQIWMKRLSPNSAQRYLFLLSIKYENITSLQNWLPTLRHPCPPSYPFKTSLKKFLDYIQTGAVEKIGKVLDKGLDPNFHDPDSGGESVCANSLKSNIWTSSSDFFALWLMLSSVEWCKTVSID